MAPGATSGRPRQGLRARREKHEEKIDRRADPGHDQKPVRSAEQREQDHEIDEIAARGGVEEPRQRPLGRIGHRGEERVAAVLRAHQAPIDEAGGAQRPKHGSRAERQRPKGVRGQAPADAHAGEYDGVHDIVAPKIENAAPSRLLEFEPRQFAVAAVEDRMRQEQERADGLHEGARGQEKRAAADPDRDGDQAHLIGRDRGSRQAARDLQRDRPLDVAGHEPVGVLDQRLEKPALRGADVGGRLDDHGIDRGKNAGRRAKARSEPGLDIASLRAPPSWSSVVRRVRSRSGRKHDDPVRDCPPAGRLDPC